MVWRGRNPPAAFTNEAFSIMRKTQIIAGLTAVLVAGSIPQKPIRAEQDKAAEIMARARAAIGITSPDTLKTFSAEARVARNIANMQMTSDTELLLEMPDKYLRSDVSSGEPVAMNSSMGFNGDASLGRMGGAPVAGGGMVVRMAGPGGAMMGPNEKLTPEQEAQMNAAAVRSARQDISRLMLGWFAMAHPSLNAQYTYAGEAESPEGRAHVIDVKNADGFAARLFIDEATNLPLMVTYEAPQPRMITRTATGAPAGAAGRSSGGQVSPEERERLLEEMKKMQAEPPAMIEYSLFFDDWREVGGLKFPHSIQRASAGTTNEEWTISKVRVNPKLDAKKFDTPKR